MKHITYAEYHRMMGEWFATGCVGGQPARQVAHEVLPYAKAVCVRVYWNGASGGSIEYLVPMTTQEGAQWTTTPAEQHSTPAIA